MIAWSRILLVVVANGIKDTLQTEQSMQDWNCARLKEVCTCAEGLPTSTVDAS